MSLKRRLCSGFAAGGDFGGFLLQYRSTYVLQQLTVVRHPSQQPVLDFTLSVFSRDFFTVVSVNFGHDISNCEVTDHHLSGKVAHRTHSFYCKGCL